jgi:hypothetical protein
MRLWHDGDKAMWLAGVLFWTGCALVLVAVIIVCLALIGVIAI